MWFYQTTIILICCPWFSRGNYQPEPFSHVWRILVREVWPMAPNATDRTQEVKQGACSIFCNPCRGSFTILRPGVVFPFVVWEGYFRGQLNCPKLEQQFIIRFSTAVTVNQCVTTSSMSNATCTINCINSHNLQSYYMIVKCALITASQRRLGTTLGCCTQQRREPLDAFSEEVNTPGFPSHGFSNADSEP